MSLPLRLRGFSLIELLVSIAVIAIIAAILIPIARATTERSRATACVNHLKQLATASLSYAAERNGELALVDRNNPNTGVSWYMPLMQYLPHQGYGKRAGSYFCPANPTPVVASGNAGWTNYAINGNLYLVNTSHGNEGQSNPDHISMRRGVRLAQLTSPKAYFIDAYDPNQQPSSTWYVTSGSRYSNPWTGIQAVHGEHVNVVFTDGHVKAFRVTPRPGNLSVNSDLQELKASYFWPL